MDIKNILFEIINEAKSGKVIIDNEEWPILFNTKIYDNNKVIYENVNDNSDVILELKDLDRFINILKIYINKELENDRKTITFSSNNIYNKIKFIISYIFINATLEDLKNPIKYIERLIKYLDDKTFFSFNNGLEIKLGNYIKDSNLVIKNVQQSITMETPYKMEFILKNKDDEFVLPEISYGIVSNNGKKRVLYL